jgi:hypothetical protein
MVLRASVIYRLHIMGREVTPVDTGAQLSLNWPRWYPLTADDRQRDAQTLRTLLDAGLISRESAVKAIADTYDIEDVSAELGRVHTDLTESRTD